MNKTLKLFLLILVISFMSCAISKKENERIENLIARQEIPSDNSLISDTITDEKLQHYEIRAIQKLEDFYSYLALLGNDNYTTSLKEEVRNSAVGLFFDTMGTINPFENSRDSSGSISVEQFLSQQLTDPLYIQFVPVNPQISASLELSDKNAFTGSIVFQVINKEDPESKRITKYADFSLRKVEKSFGNESMHIWEVFLDNIY